MAKKYIFLLIINVLCVFSATAQNIEFKANAPKTVVAGEAFQLQYSVNSQDAVKLQMPNIADFEVVAGPSTYTSQNYEFINGKSSSSVSTTITYVLTGKAEGTFSIAPASVMVEGKKYTSNSLSIKVLPPNSQKQQNNGQQPQTSNAQISNEDIFIRPIIAKTTLKEQELTLLTYKIYYRVELVNINDIKFPDFKGLMTYNIENQQNSPDIENYNGTSYYVLTLPKSQWVIAPQNTGKITISPISCTAVIRIKNSIRTGAIFNNYWTYQDVKKNIVSPSVVINSMPLPEPKPADFCGVIGSLSMSSEISNTEIDANNSVTLKINIKGNGNLKLINTPAIAFPTDIEAYEPKVVNNFNASGGGLSGSKSIEYLFIPRHAGTFEIPAVSLSYFDLSSNTYKTLHSQSFTLNVAKGTGNRQTEVSNYSNVDKQDVKQLATDIRYIHSGNLNIKPKAKVFTGSLPFYLCLIVPAMTAFLLGLFFRKKIKDNANIALMKNRKASKVAKKRLKTAEKFLKENKKDNFYDEVLNALWLYVSDKLNLPISSLNKDNIAEKLGEKNTVQEVSDGFLTLLKDCELERYAPLQNSQNAMDKIYSQAVDVIKKLEL